MCERARACVCTVAAVTSTRNNNNNITQPRTSRTVVAAVRPPGLDRTARAGVGGLCFTVITLRYVIIIIIIHINYSFIVVRRVILRRQKRFNAAGFQYAGRPRPAYKTPSARPSVRSVRRSCVQKTSPPPPPPPLAPHAMAATRSAVISAFIISCFVSLAAITLYLNHGK